MQLAEALILRSDIRKRIEQLRERLKLSAAVQEGEDPPEDPQELLAELERALAQFTSLVQRINRTNLHAALPDGRTLTEALAERDTLTLSHSVYQSTAEAASPKVERLGRSEIRKLATIKVSVLRQQMDEVARQRRELDMLIQSVNWSAEVLD